jgi:DNA transposition AAA+ family ATPase
MNKSFYEGKNYARLAAAIGEGLGRTAGLPALILVDGRAGLGKTEAAQHYAGHHDDCVYLRALENHTPRWLLKDLAHELKIDDSGRVSTIFKAILTELRRQPRAIIIDEADHLARKLNLLETIRDIYDLAAVPVVLVGMDKVGAKLRRFPQFASRIGCAIEFQPLSPEEIERLAFDWCGIELEAGAAEALFRQSEAGDFRLVVHHLAIAEQRAKLGAKQGDRLLMGPKAIEMIGRQTAKERRAA